MSLSLNNRLTPNNDTDANKVETMFEELELLKEIEPLGVYKVNEEKLMVVTTIAECTVNRVLDSIHRGYRNK